MPDRVSEIISLQLNTFALVITARHDADEMRPQWAVHLSFLAEAEMALLPQCPLIILDAPPKDRLRDLSSQSIHC